ncbi:hypothetical protein WMY93_017957 [Mugilogobius chulae]|uniref:ubiquitinyl hydrolase 1 n=1 Tax=Mugilogobius chulae TaxID=88201 RepID=A0AAW0NIN1_9GOBI
MFLDQQNPPALISTTATSALERIAVLQSAPACTMRKETAAWSQHSSSSVVSLRSLLVVTLQVLICCTFVPRGVWSVACVVASSTRQSSPSTHTYTDIMQPSIVDIRKVPSRLCRCQRHENNSLSDCPDECPARSSPPFHTLLSCQIKLADRNKACGGGRPGSCGGLQIIRRRHRRQLTADEVRLLNRPSAFDDGFTLVHLAIRFQRQDMLAVLLTEVSQQAAKCIPAMVCPELTEQIRREVAASLHQRKGDFTCYFLTDLVTFTLPADIEDLPPAVQEKLFDEVLDRDVQKELEEEAPIINWSLELGSRLDSRLYALWNRTAGDCLLDSVLQATWGIYDKDSVLRKTLHDSLHDCSHWFYTRWKEWESWYSQSFGLHFSLREEQWQEDWAFILSLASQPGSSLEQTHIFVLAHILRRPIIVYGVKYYKSFRGETLGYTRFQGVYLPLLWEQSFCWKSPIALGYTRGHFSALVAMENDGFDNRGAGANLNTDDDVTVTFLPLVDSERKLLHIHFLSAQEMGNEEQQEKLLREWLDCCVTEGGVLVALQKSSRRRNHPLVTQMVEKWLDGYRQIRPCASLSDGEEEEDDEDEE